MVSIWSRSLITDITLISLLWNIEGHSLHWYGLIPSLNDIIIIKFCMSPFMDCFLMHMDELFVTIAARIWLFSFMSPFMHLFWWYKCELFVTIRARIWLFTSVSPFMNPSLMWLYELFVTIAAGIGLLHLNVSFHESFWMACVKIFCHNSLTAA